MVTGLLRARPHQTPCMHLIYLDESGDPGLQNSPTKHYLIAGFAVHHGSWQGLRTRLQSFRREMADRYGFPATAELHASELLGASPLLHGVCRAHRLLLARQLVYMLSSCPEIRTFAWVTKKSLSDPVTTVAHQAMSDLTAWTLDGRISVDPPCRHAGFLILHDAAPSQPFRQVTPSAWLVGHPVGLSSRDDEMIQVADMIAYLVRQKFAPNRHALKNGYVTLCDKLAANSLGWREVN